jgi:hypothetical protein
MAPVNVPKVRPTSKRVFRGQADVTGLVRVTFDVTTCGEKSLLSPKLNP